jgi:hypothetical protein
MEENHERGTVPVRQPWTTPAVRTVIPVDRTRGGAFDLNDQDDLFYHS